ncbi:unnamed protein product [Protopolystoma xenopodis]|uniref:Uncharacterized protein n=1 Tax=Protopolystoma xenopodis TaxID=117903 RepID=A0A3S5AMU0_9PLAT|nr:unnamed protein product [Protopolystoma xenopodis]
MEQVLSTLAPHFSPPSFSTSGAGDGTRPSCAPLVPVVPPHLARQLAAEAAGSLSKLVAITAASTTAAGTGGVVASASSSGPGVLQPPPSEPASAQLVPPVGWTADPSASGALCRTEEQTKATIFCISEVFFLRVYILLKFIVFAARLLVASPLQHTLFSASALRKSLALSVPHVMRDLDPATASSNCRRVVPRPSELVEPWASAVRTSEQRLDSGLGLFHLHSLLLQAPIASIPAGETIASSAPLPLPIG